MPKKVLLPILLMVVGVGWLLSSNLSRGNYFVPVDEMDQYGEKIYSMNLRVKGRIIAGSIRKDAKPIAFSIEEKTSTLDVVYVGSEPLPDLFKDHAEAVVEGHLRKDGVFEAKHLQAKCASKYEGEAPTDGYPAAPVPSAAISTPQLQPGSSP